MLILVFSLCNRIKDVQITVFNVFFLWLAFVYIFVLDTLWEFKSLNLGSWIFNAIDYFDNLMLYIFFLFF